MTETRSFLVGMIVLAAWAALTLGRLWGHWPDDLAALYFAGYMLENGRPDLVYMAADTFVNEVPEPWRPAMAALGVGDRTVFPYIYPPLWAALIAPLTRVLSPQAFFDLVTVAQVGALVLGVVLAWRLMRGTLAVPFWLWAAYSAVLLQTGIVTTFALNLMQPQITVSVLGLLAVERLAANRDGQAGAALALAAALKVTPAALVLIFVLDRRWRAVGSFAACGAGLAGLSVLLAGIDLHRAFPASLAGLGDSVFLTTLNFSARSLLYGIWHWAGLVPAIGPEMRNVAIEAAPPAILWIARAGLVAALAGALAAGRGLDRALRLPLTLFLMTLALGIFGPFSWAHYFIVQVLLAPALLAIPSLPRRWLAALLVVILGSTNMLLFLNTLPWPGMTGSAIAVLGLLAAGVGLVLAARRRAPPRP